MDISKRNSNYELMRIISMIFIILWHILMHGNVINNCMNPTLKIALRIFQLLIIVHVNSFILLSGYFQSKSNFKLSKCFKLFLQVIMYSIFIVIIGIKLGWIQNYTILTFINNLLPSATSNYWFIKDYIILYIFSDYINIFIKNLTKKQYRNLLLLMFTIFSVWTYLSGYKNIQYDAGVFINFLFLYLVGAYLRLYPLKESKIFKKMKTKKYILIMFIIFMTMGLLDFALKQFAINIYGKGNILTEISTRIQASRYGYTPPMIIIQSVAYFELFHFINIKSKIINYVSSCVFGIYLFHDNPIIRSHIYKILKIDIGPFYSYKILIKIFIVTIIIFLIGLIIESIRRLILLIISKIPIIKMIGLKMKNYINSHHLEINW